MSDRLSFSQYLVGHAASAKPPFFYAYLGMWLHALLAGSLALLLTEPDATQFLLALTMASFALGLVVYALLSRAHILCVNAFSYAAIMATPFWPSPSSAALFIAALIALLVSTYALFTREYRLYHRAALAEDTPPIPTWITAGTAALVLALFAFALALVHDSSPSGF